MTDVFLHWFWTVLHTWKSQKQESPWNFWSRLKIQGALWTVEEVLEVNWDIPDLCMHISMMMVVEIYSDSIEIQLFSTSISSKIFWCIKLSLGLTTYSKIGHFFSFQCQLIDKKTNFNFLKMAFVFEYQIRKTILIDNIFNFI